MSVERAREQLELAEGRWQTAVKEHAQPPPDAGDTRRLRALAPEDVWERFDDAVESLSRARTGVSVVAIAQAFGQLSAAAWDLAEAVEQRQRQRTTRAG